MSYPVACTQIGGRVGRLWQHPHTSEQGGVLEARPLGASVRFTLAALSPQGTALAVVTSAGSVYCLHLHRNRYALLDAGRGVAGVAAAFLVRATRRLFVAFQDSSLACYDLTSSSQVARVGAGCCALRALAACGAREQLAAASGDGVAVWHAGHAPRQQRLLAHSPCGSVAVAFTPDDAALLSAAPDGTFRLWCARTQRRLALFSAPGCSGVAALAPTCVAISPDGRLLISGTRSRWAWVFDLAARQLLHGLDLGSDARCARQVQFLPDRAVAAVLSGDGCVRFVDVVTGETGVEVGLCAPGGRAACFAMDPRGSVLAAVCDDGAVRVFDLAAVRARGGQKQPPAAATASARQRPAAPPTAGAAGQLRVLTAREVEEVGAAARAAARAAPLDAGRSTAARGRVDTSLTKAAAAEGDGPRAAPAGVLADATNDAAPRTPPPSAAARAAKRHAGASSLGRTAAVAAKAAGSGRRAAAPAAAARASAEAGALRARALDAPSAALSRQKLSDMLRQYGAFPSKHRLLIWEHLLQLPRSCAAYAALDSQSTHAAYAGLSRQLPTTCPPRLRQRMERTLSRLGHWCPLFGEVSGLPALAFPFVSLWGADGHGCCEALVTLLLSYGGGGHGWWECFPDAPVSLLRKLLLALAHHDPPLAAHLHAHSAPFFNHAWGLMCGALTDAFSSADWAAAWDHVIVHGPSFLYQLLLSYLLTFRDALLATRGERPLAVFFGARRAADGREVVRHAHALLAATPPHMLAGFGGWAALPQGGPYPLVTEYPVTNLQLQRAERARIREAEAALIRRRQVVSELEQRTRQVAFQAGGLAAERRQLALLERQRRAAAREAEEQLAAATTQLDDRAKEEKLRQIRLVEEAYQSSLASLRGEWQAELAALRTEVEHRRRLAGAALKARQEEEDIKVLEFQSHQRLWALQQDMARAAGASDLQDQLLQRQAALEAQQRQAAAEWEAQDEARRLQRQHEAARRLRLAQQAEASAAQQAASGLMLAAELEAKAKLSAIQNGRVLRQLAEDAAEATAQQAEADAQRQVLAAAADEAVLRSAAQAELDRYQEEQRQRLEAVAAEQRAQEERQTALAAAAQDAGRAALLGAAERKLTELRARLTAASAREAGETDRVLRRLEQERRREEEVHQLLQRISAHHAIPAARPGAAGAGGARAGEAAPQPDARAGLWRRRSGDLGPGHLGPGTWAAGLEGSAASRDASPPAAPPPAGVASRPESPESDAAAALDRELARLRADYDARRRRLEADSSASQLARETSPRLGGRRWRRQPGAHHAAAAAAAAGTPDADRPSSSTTAAALRALAAAGSGSPSDGALSYASSLGGGSAASGSLDLAALHAQLEELGVELARPTSAAAAAAGRLPPVVEAGDGDSRGASVESGTTGVGGGEAAASAAAARGGGAGAGVRGGPAGGDCGGGALGGSGAGGASLSTGGGGARGGGAASSSAGTPYSPVLLWRGAGGGASRLRLGSKAGDTPPLSPGSSAGGLAGAAAPAAGGASSAGALTYSASPCSSPLAPASASPVVSADAAAAQQRRPAAGRLPSSGAAVAAPPPAGAAASTGTSQDLEDLLAQLSSYEARLSSGGVGSGGTAARGGGVAPRGRV